MIDVIGHLGFASLCMGVFFISRDRRVGWLLCILCNVTWISIGITIGLSSIVFWNIVLLSLNTKGWLTFKNNHDPLSSSHLPT